MARAKTRRAHSWRFVAAVLPAVVLASTACSFLLKDDQPQCQTTDDCLARGASFVGSVCEANLCRPVAMDAAPPTPVADAAADAAADVLASPAWSCLGHGAPASPALVQVQLRVVDAATTGTGADETQNLANASPVANATVALCSSFDPDCSAPISPTTVTDAQGYVTVALTNEFAGYLNITQANFTRTLVFLNAPPADLPPGLPIGLISPTTQSLFGSIVGAKAIANSSLLTMAIRDCTGGFASGVHFDATLVGNDTVPIYVVGGFPKSGLSQTSNLGSGGFFNAAVGVYTVTATLAATGQQVGSQSVLVRPGAHTQFSFITH